MSKSNKSQLLINAPDFGNFFMARMPQIQNATNPINLVKSLDERFAMGASTPMIAPELLGSPSDNVRIGHVITMNDDAFNDMVRRKSLEKDQNSRQQMRAEISQKFAGMDLARSEINQQKFHDLRFAKKDPSPKTVGDFSPENTLAYLVQQNIMHRPVTSLAAATAGFNKIVSNAASPITTSLLAGKKV